MLLVACLASIASPPPEPNTEQSPLWTASAYVAGSGVVTVTAAEPFGRELEMFVTVPSDGSGGYTSSLRVDVNVEAQGRAGWVLTLSDADGNVLDEVEVSEAEVEENGPYFSMSLSARDVLSGCEPEVSCTGTVFVDLVPGVGTLSLTWQASFAARDNVLGEDEGEYVTSKLKVVGE